MKARVSAGMLVVLAALSWFPAASVGAVTAAPTKPYTPPNVVSDARAPAGGHPLPQGDILAAGFGATASSLVFGVEAASPTDPATDPAWLAGRAFLYWQLDTTGDGQFDDLVQFIPDGHGGTSVTLSTPTRFDFCSGSGTYVAGYGYTATFARSCLPEGLSFRFDAALAYTPVAEMSSEPTDFAPDQPGLSPPVSTTPPVPVTPAGHGPNGYWMLGADGQVYPFGAAAGFAPVPGAVAMAPRPDGRGYRVTDGRGVVHGFGAAVAQGGSPTLGPDELITSIASTPTGNGYWLFSNRGRAFAFGDAQLHGDLASLRLNGAIVASAPTASGKGYFMVGRDGGIFAFGDARFHGSTGALRLNRPIVGMATSATGGYWLVASDGGVFAFAAPFRGSMGGETLNRPVNGLVAYGDGYLMVASDGGIFDFSNRAFVGSLAAHPPPAPIIGVAAFGT